MDDRLHCEEYLFCVTSHFEVSTSFELEQNSVMFQTTVGGVVATVGAMLSFAHSVLHTAWTAKIRLLYRGGELKIAAEFW